MNVAAEQQAISGFMLASLTIRPDTGVSWGRRKLERNVNALLAEEEIRLSPQTGLLVEDLRAERRERVEDQIVHFYLSETL